MGDTVQRPDETAPLAACRKFALSDAMILLAGLALALSAGAHLLPLMAAKFDGLVHAVSAHQSDMLDNWPLVWRSTHHDLRNFLWYTFQFVTDILGGMTLAFFVVRLRRPRPSWRNLVRQPGFVAALAMVFGLFWIYGLLCWLVPERADPFTTPFVAVGATVAVAWAALVCCRRWSAEPGWVDRVGRLLGATAIGIALLGLIIFRI
jgi:hypothetical protein